MEKELIAQRNPKSPIAEIFRTLRTNIQFTNKEKLKTILVTSTMPGEGKSWVSSNLAVTFAQTGKKVLLVDSDMRKGRLAKLFKVEKVPGLSNLLSGVDENGINEEIGVARYIKETAVDNLFIIPTGNVPPNPAELLGAETTPLILEKLKEVFDVIILDGTPSLLVTDAMVLSRIVDTTLLVASYKTTKKEDIQKVRKNIENVGGKIAGVVLNKMPIKSKEYLSTYYYGNSTETSSTRKPKVERITEQPQSKTTTTQPEFKMDLQSMYGVEQEEPANKTMEQDNYNAELIHPDYRDLQARYGIESHSKEKEEKDIFSLEKKQEILSQLDRYMEDNNKGY